VWWPEVLCKFQRLPQFAKVTATLARSFFMGQVLYEQAIEQ
jgi:hypothetical protein